MGNAVGVDIIEIDRIQATLKRFGERFLKRIYTPLEIAYCRGKTHRLAGRFAAKEATMKALGTGVRGVSWRDIEVIPNRRGKPLLYLHGGALARAKQLKLHDAEVSLSHSRRYAVAFVMAAVEEPAEDPAAWRLRYGEIVRQRGLLP